MENFTIGNCEIGENCPVFIVAEMSANHRKDYNLAVETIYAAKEAGADAIKFQTYTPDTITINSKKKYFKIDQDTPWDGRYLYELYEEAYMPWDWFERLFEIAKKTDIVAFSAVFDKSSVDFLEKLNAPAYKIASYEITDTPLIRYAASKQKPMLISTGVALGRDINLALLACNTESNRKLVFMKCASRYPALCEDMNLANIPFLAINNSRLAGFSDHSTGIYMSVAAAALGARVIEKHFILDKKYGGPDSAFSIEPWEFKTLVEQVRAVDCARGKNIINDPDKIKAQRQHARSLFVVEDIKKGEYFTEDNVRSIRPGFGLHPRTLVDVIKRTASMDIEKGTPLMAEHLNDYRKGETEELFYRTMDDDIYLKYNKD